jgi:hypothetical protein
VSRATPTHLNLPAGRAPALPASVDGGMR